MKTLEHKDIKMSRFGVGNLIATFYIFIISL